MSREDPSHRKIRITVARADSQWSFFLDDAYCGSGRRQTTRTHTDRAYHRGWHGLVIGRFIVLPACPSARALSHPAHHTKHRNPPIRQFPFVLVGVAGWGGSHEQTGGRRENGGPERMRSGWTRGFGDQSRTGTGTGTMGAALVGGCRAHQPQSRQP